MSGDPLAATAILAPEEAARLLPVPTDSALRWLESEGLLMDILGHPVVVWGLVVQHLMNQRANDVESPVAGCRAAGSVLGVGRDQVRRVIAELPPSRRPAQVTARGGRRTPWWPSPAALRSWWDEIHRSAAADDVNRIRRTTRKPKTRAVNASIEDRWAALTTDAA